MGKYCYGVKEFWSYEKLTFFHVLNTSSILILYQYGLFTRVLREFFRSSFGILSDFPKNSKRILQGNNKKYIRSTEETRKNPEFDSVFMADRM
jgi:hypothetical protein